MKYAAIAACWAIALVVVAAPKVGYVEPTIQQDLQVQAQSSIKSMPEWIDLTNQLAQFVIDKVDYTDKVAQVADAPTKAAIKALAAMVVDLKQAVADEKRLIKALANGVTNEVVVGN